jgi:DNA-directed RNA polymerase subunit RPC12/RpoP
LRSLRFLGISTFYLSLIPIPPFLFPPPALVLLIAIGVVVARNRVKADRKFAQHRPGTRCCAACGYPGDGLPTLTCPECGSRRFVITRAKRGVRWVGWLLMAWLLACVLGEAHLLVDELAFMREAIASGQTGYGRDRRGTIYQNELYYYAGQFWCVDD